MRHLLLSLFAGLTLVAGSAGASDPVVADAAPADSAVPTHDPAQPRLAVLKALRNNDLAGLLTASGGEDALREFLSEGSDQTKASVAAAITDDSASESDRDALRLWTTLISADGVAKASAEWYPKWQAQVPQMLAGLQMAQTGIGESIATSTSMTAVERAQLTELQWAFGAWLSRTDFADRKAFDRVLGLARDWILASGAAHPFELQLTSPDKRLQLGDQAIAAGKQALTLYGLDANAILASVKIEQLERNGDRARLRTSLKILDVPLTIDEDLQWFENDWRDAEEVAATLKYRAEAEAQPQASADSSDDAAVTALDQDPVFVSPAAPKSINGPGCSAPE